eukprot:scaffold5853_cov112-Isochrysis_galbana.AAC.1
MPRSKEEGLVAVRRERERPGQVRVACGGRRGACHRLRGGARPCRRGRGHRNHSRWRSAGYGPLPTPLQAHTRSWGGETGRSKSPP